ncbi:ProV protein [Streptococcus sanguinis SK355]|uniref:ProV protein n=1 Tax=Streptococcus sanguinis SK355 TaxID=888816 RepID=F3USK8_STRSA|nr:ProV protein [Streptococcus sanguinis SK355]
MILDEGRVQPLGFPQGILQQPANDIVKQLLDLAGVSDLFFEKSKLRMLNFVESEVILWKR